MNNVERVQTNKLEDDLGKLCDTSFICNRLPSDFVAAIKNLKAPYDMSYTQWENNDVVLRHLWHLDRTSKPMVSDIRNHTLLSEIVYFWFCDEWTHIDFHGLGFLSDANMKITTITGLYIYVYILIITLKSDVWNECA